MTTVTTGSATDIVVIVASITTAAALCSALGSYKSDLCTIRSFAYILVQVFYCTNGNTVLDIYVTIELELNCMITGHHSYSDYQVLLLALR